MSKISCLNVVYSASEMTYGPQYVHSCISEAFDEISDRNDVAFLTGESLVVDRWFGEKKLLQIPRVKLKGRGLYRLFSWGKSRELKKRLDLSNYDVVFLDGLGALLPLVPLIKEFSSISFVVVIHGKVRVNRRMKRLLKRGVYSNIKFVAVSEPIRKYAQETLVGVASSNIVTIDNGIDYSEFNRELYPREMAREQLNLNNDCIYAVAVGRLVKEKDFATLIQSFKYLRKANLKLVIIGEGELRGELERLIVEEGVENRVSIFGHLSDAKRYLSAFDFYICSSINEGLPLAILEASAAGLPILLSDIEVLKYFSKGVYPHFQAGDSRDLADKLGVLLAGDEFGKEAASIMKGHYDIEVLKRNYKSLVAGLFTE